MEANSKRTAFERHTRASSLARRAKSGSGSAAYCRRERPKSKTFSRWRKQARRPGDPGMELAPV